MNNNKNNRRKQERKKRIKQKKIFRQLNEILFSEIDFTFYLFNCCNFDFTFTINNIDTYHQSMHVNS